MQTLQEPVTTNGNEMMALLTTLTALKKGAPGVRLPFSRSKNIQPSRPAARPIS